MVELKHIDKKLSEASSLLDQIANDLSGTDLIQRKAWLKLIAESLCPLIVLQRGIYLMQPELKPKGLEKEPIDRAANRQFGQIILGIQGILAKNKPLKAIEILEDYISKNPPAYLLEAASNEVAKIKKDFNV
jgi:hypothetical protein